METVHKTRDGHYVTIQKVMACEHLSTMNNPFLSTTLNVAVKSTRTVYLVVEELKINLLCSICGIRTCSTLQNHRPFQHSSLD